MLTWYLKLNILYLSIKLFWHSV